MFLDIFICLNGLLVIYFRKISLGNGKVYVFEDNLVIWFMVDISCKNVGGILVMIYLYDEYFFIKFVLGKLMVVLLYVVFKLVLFNMIFWIYNFCLGL